jgi:hypothetical protein
MKIELETKEQKKLENQIELLSKLCREEKSELRVSD